MKVPPWILAPFTNITYRVWCSTLRITQTGREPVNRLEAQKQPMVFPIWHDELFALMHVRGTLRIITVVSQSRDGEYLARLLQALGLVTARGSSSRGGIRALLQAARFMREENYNACITVDGPRGPRHVVKPGAIFLAFRTPAYLVPIRVFIEKAKVFRSWDRFQLPLPFSRVHVAWGEPYRVSAENLNEEALEHECRELESRLNTLSGNLQVQTRER